MTLDTTASSKADSDQQGTSAAEGPTQTTANLIWGNPAEALMASTETKDSDNNINDSGAISFSQGASQPYSSSDNKTSSSPTFNDLLVDNTGGENNNPVNNMPPYPYPVNFGVDVISGKGGRVSVKVYNERFIFAAF